MKLPLKILLIIVCIYSIYILKNNIYKTNYDINTTEIIGIIDYINISENKVSLEIKGKEKIIVNLYKYSNFNYELGDKILVKGTLKQPSNNTNFNLFNYKKYLKSKKIYWIMTGEEITLIKKNSNILYKIKNKIISKINKYKNKEYFKMFILGDTKDIDTNIYDSYKINGITHLFSISGMHISLLSVILLKLFKNNYKIVIIFLLFYLFLARFTPSIIRATFLFILLYLNKKFKLNFKSYEILLFIFLMMLLYNPYYLYNVGFIFSFLISFNLMIFSNYINKYNNYFVKLFITSLISFISSIPIMINNYFSINISSIFLNMIFVPFVSVIVFPLSLITFIFSFLEPIFNITITILENMSCFLNKFSLEIIFCKINIIIEIIYLILGYLSLKKLFNKKYLYLIIYILILFIHTNYYNKETSLTMLDVGQGDSLLLRLKDKIVLIDTGGNYNYELSDNIIIPYLKSEGIKKIDYLILTHGDYDHLGSSFNLVNKYKVNSVIFNHGNYNELELELIKLLENSNINYYQNIKELDINNNKLYFLNDKLYDNENDNSNVVYIKINDFKLLFMGDAGIKTEEDIIKQYDLNNIDILKVGHHGSSGSSSKKFIDKINPKYSLISVGINNIYKHPNKKALKNLENSIIYRTDIVGSVKFEMDGNKLNIITCL